MISLENDRLEIRFPNIAIDAGIHIDFQRTLRIPDDGRDHFLPPGLGRFPLRHVEDCALGGLEHRKARGGIVMPIFQTDALWLNFGSFGGLYPKLPVALKIGAGKINAVSGLRWAEGLSQDPQDYVVLPGQPWLDGFNTGRRTVRQFVAAPLGEGYTVEEQIDPQSDVGGLQIEAIPMKKSRYAELIERYNREEREIRYCLRACASSAEMGLGMGGSMRQEIQEDEYGLDAWDLENRQRCFVMLANAQQWMAMTGEAPPLSPISAREYSKAGLPWFDYYDGDRKAIEGARALGRIKTVKTLSQRLRAGIWPEDGPLPAPKVKTISPHKVKDGSW
ncbi:hypothetical protein PVT71_00305 [Salipiger sp. H15]|uniref:Uncharacterized protein n=1 Tax=Alloyangia sp. H15 TaxID=3029062 RepID=A0AAU8AFG5_9RHOB